MVILTFCMPLSLYGEKRPVRIGAILGLTGVFGEVSTLIRQGMELAVDEHPEELKLYIEDDNNLHQQATATAFTKLVTVDDVSVVLQYANTTMPTLAPLAESYKTPIIEFWDHNKALLELGSYIFSSGMSTEESAKKMARFAYQAQRIDSMAIIKANDPWSEVVSRAFIDEFTALGGKLSYQGSVNSEDVELRGVVLKAKQSKARGLYLPLFSHSLYSSIKHAKTLGFSGAIYTADGFVESDIKVLRGHAEGVYSTQGVILSERFIKRYTTTYNQSISPLGAMFVALGYDAVQIVHEAARQIVLQDKEVTRETLREHLTIMDYTGVSGRSVLKGTEGTKIESIVVVKNGVFELVK